MTSFNILTRLKQSFFVLIFTVFFTTPPALAGSNQTTEPKHQAKEITTFAKKVERYAASQGARAFIIARVGRPIKDLPKGIKFTHTAIAVYSSIQLANGETAKGYAIHNLYQKSDQLDVSSLVVDYPTDFFWGADELKAGIIIPTPDLQQRIVNAIANGQNKAVHNANYSVIANPFNSQFQNCTEHTLDIINAAIYQTADKEQLKLNAKAHFQPQRVKTSPFKLFLGRAFMDDVTTKDHKGKIYTATFTSIGKYLQQNSLAKHSVIYDSKGQVSPLI